MKKMRIFLIMIVGICSGLFFMDNALAAQSGIVNDSGVRFRKGPSTSYAILTTLNTGASLTINSSTTAKNSGCTSGLWYQATYGSTSGYICADYVTLIANNSTTSTEYDKTLQSLGFPSTYWPYLRALHQAHPTWVFKPLNTGLAWNNVVSKESNIGVSLIQGDEGYRSTANGSYNYYTNAWTALDGTNWYAANSSTVGYYLDPRNWLAENTVFMFEDLSYNSTYHTKAMVTNILSPTKLGNYDSNYANYFMSAASSYGISPIYLAARVRQEIGTSTAVISGASFSYNSKSYSKLYNPYNIGATSGTDNWKKGLVWANGGENGANKTYLRPWNTIEKSIKGGANYLATGYINNKQNTNYLQRFNVANGLSKVASHQYMTNIKAPSSESKSTYSSYNSYGMLNKTLVFTIPVYSNMPTSTSLPSTGNPNNYLKSLTVNGSSVSNFNGATTSYTVTVPSTTSSVNIGATRVVNSGSITGTGNVSLTSTTTARNIVVKAANGDTKTYTITFKKSGTTTTVTGTNPNVTTSVATIINNAGYKIKSSYLSGITLGSTVNNISSKITNKGGSISVRNINGSNKKSGQLFTGDKITVSNGSTSTTYNVIINGDATGDGKVTAVDYMKIKNYILKSSGLGSIYKEAADVNGDNKITAVDYVNVKNHILGKKSTIK